MLLPGEERRLCITSNFKDVRKFGKMCQYSCENLISEIDVTSIELAVVEAATNIVEHGYANIKNAYIELCIKHIGNFIEFSLIHKGELYIPDNFDSPDKENQDIMEVSESGRGFFLIKEIMDSIKIESEKGLNIFRMYKSIIDKPLYNRSPIPLLSELENSAKVAKEEIEVAQELHKKLRPENLPEIRNIKIFAKSEPAQLLGGDYIAIHKIDNNSLYFMICDAMGKGMSAAFFSVIAHVTFRSILYENPGISPAEILSRANRIMADDFDTFEMFMTAQIGRVCTNTKTFTYASAGHCQPILFTPHEGVQLLETVDFMLGVDSDINYCDFIVDFDKGSKLLVYTDGLTDISDSEGNVIGVDPLLYACSSEFPIKDIKTACANIFNDVKVFSGGKLQDDLSMIGIEFLQ